MSKGECYIHIISNNVDIAKHTHKLLQGINYDESQATASHKLLQGINYSESKATANHKLLRGVGSCESQASANHKLLRCIKLLRVTGYCEASCEPLIFHSI